MAMFLFRVQREGCYYMGAAAHIVAIVLEILGTHNTVDGCGRIVIIRCYDHRAMRTLILNTSLLAGVLDMIHNSVCGADRIVISRF